MTTSSNQQDEKQDDYRDDPGEFGQSSDLARTGTSDVTTGGGPDDSSKDPAGTSPGAGNNAGSQEDWRGPQAATGPAERTPTEGEDVGGIATSSANLGNSLPDGASDNGTTDTAPTDTTTDTTPRGDAASRP